MLSTAEENSPKHSMRDSSVFHKGREKLGNLILKKMAITGGTDVDWLVERKGGFIILETKEFSENIMTISLGQMIAFESRWVVLIPSCPDCSVAVSKSATIWVLFLYVISNHVQI